jgi:hypothetical protein
MDLSLGQAPQGMPDNTFTPITQAPAGSVETAKLPLVEQPIKDQISQTLPGGIQVTVAYSASAQVPVLAKPTNETPKEEKKGPATDSTGPKTESGETKMPTLAKPVSEGSSKTEKKDEKKAAEQNDPGITDQSVDANQQQVDGDQKPQKEQGEGQSGGGQGGSDSGSDSSGSGGSGNFSGGSQDNSHRQSGEGSASLEVGGKTSVTAAANLGVESEITSPPSGVTSVDTVKLTTVAGMAADGAQTTNAIDPLQQKTGITADGLFSPPINPAQFFNNGGKLSQELYPTLVKQAASMPAGADKVRFMDFLLHVQTALTEFQDLLRSIESRDSKGAVERGKAKLEATLAKIETQRKEQEKMNKKAEEAAAKQKILGPLMAIFAFLFVILLAVILLVFAMTLLMTGPAGWMAISMLVCTMVDQFATMIGKKPFLMQKFVEAIITISDKMVESAHANDNLTAEQMKNAKTVGKTVIVSLVMALTVAMNPLVFVVGGVGALVAFLQESHIVRDMQMMEGKSEMDASMAEMFATIAVTAVFVIAALVGALVCPPALMSGVASAVSSAFARAGQFAADLLTQMLTFLLRSTDVVAKAVKTIMAFMRVVLDPEVLVSLTSLGLQTTSSVITYRYESLLADIAIIQGRMDSEVELKEATIMILKKMIKQLIDGLQGTGDEIKQVGQLLKKTHSSVSDMTSSLFA